MRELRPGLWHWESEHPEWTEDEPWHKVVSSYAIDDDERLLLFDPLAVPSEIEERATGRESVVVLTAPWHERDAQSLADVHRVAWASVRECPLSARGRAGVYWGQISDLTDRA